MIDHNVRKVSLYSNLLMVTTSIHHVYGAIIYNTPWRMHVLALSIPVLVATAVLQRLYLVKKKAWVLWIYSLIIFVPSLAMIGVFEGVYNHLAKNIVFFAGASKETLQLLFPPPTYEMPNNLLFEFTGVLQAVLVLPLLIYFVRMIKLTSSRS